jgi:hypothetical protein
MVDGVQRSAIPPQPPVPTEGAPSSAVWRLALTLSGICFLLYPALRPFSDESSLDGARAFASSRWIVAHSLGIVAFVLLALGVFGRYGRRHNGVGNRHATAAVTLIWIGVGLTLPYYGAEAFGLHAAGQQALNRNDPALLTSLTHAVRWQTGIWFILTGLILLAFGTVVLAIAIWNAARSVSPSRCTRWSGIPLAIGTALYVPQFAGPQPIRVAHSVVMTAHAWRWCGTAIREALNRRLAGSLPNAITALTTRPRSSRRRAVTAASAWPTPCRSLSSRPDRICRPPRMGSDLSLSRVGNVER